VGFSSATLKHWLSNVSETGEFAYNLATLPLIDAAKRSSSPVQSEIYDFEFARIESAPCKLVRLPCVFAPPWGECKWIEATNLKARLGNPAQW
jgi:flavin reductase (DIM6/NTAB) family NADH-FMN oxidoreductase RutF